MLVSRLSLFPLVATEASPPALRADDSINCLGAEATGFVRSVRKYDKIPAWKTKTSKTG